MTEEGNGLPELPQGWEWTRLEDCVDILDSQRVPVNANERGARIAGKSKHELYPYYGATGQVGWIDDYLFDEELVLLGEDGAPFLKGTRNKAYIIRGKSWVNNHAHVLRALFGITTNSFLCHYLNVFDYHDYVTGTTRLKLNQSRMRKISVYLPSLAEQQRIVAKIEELFTQLDAGVAALEKAKAQLRRYRQAVLKAAVEGELTREWREAHRGGLEPASVLLERILEERRMRWEAEHLGKRYKPPVLPETDDLPALPDRWVWASLKQLAERIQYGHTESAKEEPIGPKFLRITDIQDGRVNWDTVPYCKCSEEQYVKYRLVPGDIVFTRTGATTGKSYLISDCPDAVFASYLIRLQISKQLDTKYVALFLTSPIYWSQIMIVKKGSAQSGVNATILATLRVPFPPLAEQHRIVAEVEQRLSVADEMEKAVEQSLKRAERLRQSILKRAFEGKLVPQDPSDEPASVLLERIKAEKARREAERKGKKRSRKKKQTRQLKLL